MSQQVAADQPIIEEERSANEVDSSVRVEQNTQQTIQVNPQINADRSGGVIKVENGNGEKIQEEEEEESGSESEKDSAEIKPKLEVKEEQEEAKIDEELFNIPQELLREEEKLQTRVRNTRWGERQIKRSKIQEDAIFNPLEALYSGNSLLPITQYGQAELEVKMQLYNDGKPRKSKWHHEIEKTFTPPCVNYISPNLALDEVEYILRLYRLDELTSIISDYQPEDPDIRSPSPEPIYDRDGKRINTREVRKRDQLHRERITLIEDCMKMRPNSFIPPQDYKPLKKFKKIYLTEAAINDKKANYVGKLIGPEGRTQKLIEKRSGCRINVRGRGANKNQKDIFENFEPLHIIIVADNDQSLQKGVEQVQKRLNDDQDDQIKQMLQSLNGQLVGIFKDNFCENCQVEGHRTWACPFATQKAKVNVTCSICGESSHPTSDCPEKQAYLKTQQSNKIAQLLESQYNMFKDDVEEKEAKPKGGIAFITDIDRKKMLSIGADPSQAQTQQQSGSAPITMGAYQKQEMKDEADEDVPKFEDD